MAIYKNNNGTWYVMIRYQDWTGARKQKCKRGFATRKEAADWELQFKLQKKASLDMTMESFCALYEEDVRPSLKQSTWLTKENIIQKKILPYLGQRKVSEITAKDVMDWHNQMRKLKTKTGKYLSPTYLKTIHGTNKTYEMDRIKMCNWPTVEPFQIGIVRNEPQDIIPELTVEYWFRQNNVENHANSRDYFNTVANNKFVSIAEGDTSKKSFKRLHRWRYSPTAAYGNNEVHLHPYQPRRISIAEALSIQSLPVWFEVLPTLSLSAKFKMVGNGVPYLLANGIAMELQGWIEEHMD